MENQVNVGGQNNQPPVVKKPKANLWMISTLILVFLFFGILSWYFLNTQQLRNQKNVNSLPTQTSTPTQQVNTQTNAMIALVKDGDIYVADNSGTTSKVFETKQEELAVPKSFYIKLSPDKKFLAYLGTSGGLDSAIKVIDINQKKKIFQDVYGSAYITDFAWSPDSKKIAVAVNLKNDEKDFTTSLYLIDLFNQLGGEPLFKAENIEITHVEWPTIKYVYYSRLSHAKETLGTIGIVSYDTETQNRKVKNLTSWTTPSFWFKTSPTKDKIFFYTFPDFAPQPDPYFKMLSLPSLEETAPEINFGGDVKSVDWFDNYLVGISMPYGSPDQSVVLYDLSNNQTQSLLDMGPSGTFHSVKLLKQDGKRILVVWSEFDGKHSVSAYDLEKLIETGKKAYISEPLWRLFDSSSLDL